VILNDRLGKDWCLSPEQVTQPSYGQLGTSQAPEILRRLFADRILGAMTAAAYSAPSVRPRQSFITK
jgi:hypothetical protein